MDIQEYSELALRTANKENAIIHACFGMCGEAGEIIDYVKKGVFYGKDMDTQHLVEEVGDLMWYINLLVSDLGVTWDEVLTTNIRKLEARYPGGTFNADHAINRDTVAEKAAMEGA